MPLPPPPTVIPQAGPGGGVSVVAPTPSACPPQSRGGCLGACALLWASGPWWGGNTVVAPPGDTHLGQQRGAGSGIILGCRPHPLLPPHGTASLPPPPHTGGAHRRMEGGKPTACPMCPPCPPCVPHPARLPPCMCTPLHAPPRTASRELQPVFVAPRNTRRVLNRAPPPSPGYSWPPPAGDPRPPPIRLWFKPPPLSARLLSEEGPGPLGTPRQGPPWGHGSAGGAGVSPSPPHQPPPPHWVLLRATLLSPDLSLHSPPLPHDASGGVSPSSEK